MRRLLFSADGSSGDMLPMVLMAEAFQREGYEVCVCAPQEFAKMASDFGVPFEGYQHNYTEIYLQKERTGYVANMLEAIRHRGLLFEKEYELLREVAPGYDVLFNFMGEIFVPSIAEAFGLKNIKLFTFPVMLSDRYGPPSGMPFVTENKWVNRLQWHGAVVSARLFGFNKTINGYRAEMGLPPISNLLADNARCDHMMMGVYEELMPPCPTWASIDHTYIGPCLPTKHVPLSDPLEAFLDAGDPPVYIGFGSMQHSDGDALTRTLTDSIRKAGVRAIIAQATSDNIGGGMEDADDIYVLKEYPIPHHILFPRCKAAVHHGSWITSHLAARAGIPQLVMPAAVDQYLWSWVVSRAGLGPKGVDINRLRGDKLTAALTDLTQRAEYEQNARALADRHASVDGVKNALELVQQLELKWSSGAR